jgi:metal-dependent amidase/aminoacylase/carboxypeptidase family protein|tara:strand:+ start:2898 stop:3005 length:108 start_codon:yes stop_codon:yes gene_type:complete
MAAADEFSLKITGRGGHAAAPHEAIDPNIAAAHII